jgi:hypothetical protein
MKWVRTLVTPSKPAKFTVKVVIEGYRPMKDQWEHETYDFAALEEAIAFYSKIMATDYDERGRLLDFGRYEGQGWYGFSVEDVEIYEHAADGLYKWERQRDAARSV